VAKKIPRGPGTPALRQLIVKNDEVLMTCQADPELLRHLENAWRERPDQIRAAFRRLVWEQAIDDLSGGRYRGATLNALVPEGLKKQFEDACEKLNTKKTPAMKLVLSRYIDFESGVRRMAYGPKRTILKDPFGFRQMMAPDQAAVDRAEFKAEAKGKIQFDARTKPMKRVVQDLIEAVGVGTSQFFAFVLSKAIEELEKRAPDLSADQKPDVAAEASPGLPVQTT
jgi:hypothetical protein